MLAVQALATVLGEAKLGGGAKRQLQFECTVEYFDSVGAFTVFRGHDVPPRFRVTTRDGRSTVVDATEAERKVRKKALVLQLHAADVLNVTTAEDRSRVVVNFHPPGSKKARHAILIFDRAATPPPAKVTAPAAPLAPQQLDAPSTDLPAATATAAAEDSEPLAAFGAALYRAAFPRGALHLTALISPVSGKGEGVKQWHAFAQPLLDVSPHTVAIILTTHRGHAEEYAAGARLRPNEVIVAVGGDGMAHEVLNGLHTRSQREDTSQRDGERATHDIPVALFPTGSGCALAKALGVIEPLDAALALLHARCAPMDLMDLAFAPVSRLVRPEGKPKAERVEAPAEALAAERRTAFMTLNFAFGAAVDVESEVYRWMGNARFTFYALKKMVGGVPEYPITVEYLPVTAGDYSAPHRAAGGTPLDTYQLGSTDAVRKAATKFDLAQDIQAVGAAQAVPRTAGADGGEQWVRVEQDAFVFVIACNIAWIARDMLAAPHAHLNDRCIDLVFAAPGVTRTDLVKALVEMEDGAHLANPRMRYVKCRAVRFTPRDGLITIDGEKYPLSAITARVADDVRAELACMPVAQHTLATAD